jgi:hypothetical protein
MKKILLVLFFGICFFHFEGLSQKLEHDWENYVVSIKDKPVSINVDLGLKPAVPVIDLPLVIIVRLKLKQPNAFGMPEQDELGQLDLLEEKLVASLSRGQGAMYVGRFTQRGIREFYFYTNDTLGYRGTIYTAFVVFSEYEWLAQAKKDQDWQNYLSVLYPSASEKLMIDGRRQLAIYQSKNVNLTKVSISHFFEFAKEDAFKKFLQSEVCSKFTVNQLFKKPDGSAFSLVLYVTTDVNREWLEKTIPVLFSESKKHGGLYKGWEIDQ